MKIRLVGTILFHADRYDEVSRFLPFCERAEKSHGVKCPSIANGKEGCWEWGVVSAEYALVEDREGNVYHSLEWAEGQLCFTGRNYRVMKCGWNVVGLL
jgi:hypothetical protein